MARAPESPDLTKLPKKLGPWSRVHLDTGGEFLLRVVFEQYGIGSYRDLASGWNGDRLAVYRHAQGERFAFFWVVRWDDQSYPERVARLGSAALPFSVTKEAKVTVLSGGFKPEERGALRKVLGDHI